MSMMNIDPNATAKRVVFLSWFLVAIFYFYLCYDYIRIDMSDSKLGEYVHYVVQLAGNENRSGREIRALLLVKAEELNLPVTSEQIKIQGAGQDLKVSVNYDVGINIPVLKPGFYAKHYEHNASYRSPR